MAQIQYFSMDGFCELIQRAREQGYIIIPFRKARTFLESEVPLLIMRHDVDLSLWEAFRLAKLEAKLNVSATYFIQVNCPYYNTFSPESVNIVQEIIKLGHEIGLHYDSNRYIKNSVQEAKEAFTFDKQMLENLTCVPVISVSQHTPIDSPLIQIRDLVENDAYDTIFCQQRTIYISDSLCQWRQYHPLGLILKQKSFQLLLHPIYWTVPGENFRDKLNILGENLKKTLDMRIQSTIAYYQDCLENRENLDQKYREQKKHSS